MRLLPLVSSAIYSENDSTMVSADWTVINIATYFPDVLDDSDKFLSLLQEKTVIDWANRVKESGQQSHKIPSELLNALCNSRRLDDINDEYNKLTFRRLDAGGILGMHYTLNRLKLEPSLRKCIYLYSKKTGASEQTGWNIWRQYANVSQFLLAEVVLIGIIENTGIDFPRASKDDKMFLMRSMLRTALDIYKYGVGYTDTRTGKPLLDVSTAWIIPERCAAGGISLINPHFFDLRGQERAWLDEYSKRNV